MPILQRVRRFARSLAARWTWSVSQPPPVSFRPASAAGVPVDADSALSLSAVFAACNLISRVIGSLPLTVYQRAGRERWPAYTHPAWKLLAFAPNREMTAVVLRRVLEWHRLLFGNAYAQVIWAGNGKPLAIWPVEPWRVKPRRDAEGQLYYEVDSGKTKLDLEDVIHVPLVSADGVIGRSFIDYAIDSLGLGIAAQQFAAQLFQNGAKPGGILRHPLNVSEPARKEMKRAWNDGHGGVENAGKTAILWGGWEYVAQNGMFAPEQAQLLETRKFTTEEVARWLNIPPHLLRDLARATFSNIEQQSIDFLTYSLGPTLTEYEQEYDRKLLSPPDLYSKHLRSALLQGDSAARSSYYRELFGIGVLSPNDIREAEEWNPIAGGDTHFIPVNMAPLTAPASVSPTPILNPPAEPAGPAPAPVPQPQPTPAVVPPVAPSDPAAMRGLLVDTFDRLARVEWHAIRRAAGQPAKFLGWVDGYYPTHERRLAEALAPVLRVAVPWARADEIADKWCLESKALLLDLAGKATAAGFADAVEAELDGWVLRSDRAADQWMGGQQ